MNTKEQNLTLDEVRELVKSIKQLAEVLLENGEAKPGEVTESNYYCAEAFLKGELVTLNEKLKL
jgi:hypothetical protein